jgi:hypothetical protein
MADKSVPWNIWRSDFVAFIAVAGALWLLLSPVFDSSFRYQVQYWTSADMVTIAREPIDCDFWSAPLGIKGCHYEKVVTVVKYGASFEGSKSRPVASYDGGKTWQWNDGGPLEGARVYVTWHEVTP